MPSTIGIVASGVDTTPPWAPTDLTNLLAWYDASDASTFTYSSGTVVSQWNDKSGNARHLAQSTVGSQPTRSATLNGLSVVTFDGSDDFMTADAGSDAFDVSPWTCWAVVDLTATADFDRILTFRRSATGANDFDSPNCIPLFRNSNSGGYEIAAHSSGTASANSTGTAAAMIVHSRMDGSNVYSGVNGTWSAATAATAPANQRYLRIGGLMSTSGNPPDSGATNSLSGVVAELFICNATVTATNAISYLSTKWGI